MENEEQKLVIIQSYIEAYNNFDVEGMTEDLHENIVFKNIANQEVNLTTVGKAEFKNQANQAKQLFKSRKQTITSTIVNEDSFEIMIDYQGVIAIDLPNGMKENDEIKLVGKSIFSFENDKIIAITDIS
jgi:ketosteroid isomerase-like protein